LELVNPVSSWASPKYEAVTAIKKVAAPIMTTTIIAGAPLIEYIFESTIHNDYFFRQS